MWPLINNKITVSCSPTACCATEDPLLKVNFICCSKCSSSTTQPHLSCERHFNMLKVPLPVSDSNSAWQACLCDVPLFLSTMAVRLQHKGNTHICHAKKHDWPFPQIVLRGLENRQSRKLLSLRVPSDLQFHCDVAVVYVKCGGFSTPSQLRFVWRHALMIVNKPGLSWFVSSHAHS